MHRPDAATVSYTEVQVVPQRATLRYYAGTPCSALGLNTHYFDGFVAKLDRGDRA